MSWFIAYAVQGLRDGLNVVLQALQTDQFEITWRKYVYDKFAEIRLQQRKRNVFVRQRRLILDMPWKDLSISQMVTATPELTQLYAGLSAKTIRRDLDVLKELDLIRQTGVKYAPNIALLAQQTPTRRKQGQLGPSIPLLSTG